MKKIKATEVTILEEKMNALKKAYAEAEKDPERNKVIQDWETLDMEGWE